MADSVTPRQGRKVTVIGAGIVGIACASFLQRDGHDVTVVDSGPPGGTVGQARSLS